jgi:hypothetical protein
MFWTFFTKFKEFFMKNALKLFGIIAIVAVIGFWAVSCGDNGNGRGNTGGDAIEGNNITSGAEVVYDATIGNLDKEKIDFSFYFYNINDRTYLILPLSNCLDGSPSVKLSLSENKVSINLGTPKSDYLEDFNDYFRFGSGITLNTNNVKIFIMLGFYTSDDKYCLGCMKDEKNSAMLLYADKDVTVNGKETHIGNGVSNTIFNASIKKGWNYLIHSYEETELEYTVTYTSSTTQPSGFKWIVARVNRGVDPGPGVSEPR